MGEVDITRATGADADTIAALVNELLAEIMDAIGERVFDYDRDVAAQQAQQLISGEKYWAFLARDATTNAPVGLVTLYESYALYTQGAYGTIPELYVRPDWRAHGVGKQLLAHAVTFAHTRGWHRLEVTTPPLPQSERTLAFYQANGFTISGGRKLKFNV